MTYNPFESADVGGDDWQGHVDEMKQQHIKDKALTTELQALEKRVEELEQCKADCLDAIIWTTGHPDFGRNDGKYSEGASKVIYPVIDKYIRELEQALENTKETK